MADYSKLPEDYADLLEELECPICTDYITIPIKQCVTGHSVCGKCRERLDNCALCRSPFTENRNYSLEAIALKMQYPCINKDAGCTKLLSYGDKEQHEMTCMVKKLLISCEMKHCNFTGEPVALRGHWIAKKGAKRIYGAYNKCSARIKPSSYFVNLVEAFNEMFWFKCMTFNENIYFAMQYIGAAENAHKFFYQIEISHPILHKKKVIVSDYCKSMALPNEDLFQDDICIVMLLSSLKQFISNDENREMSYVVRVFRVNGRPKRQKFQNSRNHNVNRGNNWQRRTRNENTNVNRPEEVTTLEDQSQECCTIL